MVIRLLFLLGLLVADFRPAQGQVLVTTRPPYEAKISLPGKVTARPLNELLAQLKKRYQIDLLYEDQLTQGLIYQGPLPAWTAAPQSALETLLRPYPLRVERIRENAYLLLAKPLPAPNQPTKAVQPGEPAQPNLPPLLLSLRGKVLDEATQQPIPFANVYMNGSTKGTQADANGHYLLTNLPLRSVEVVASAVGYSPLKRTIDLAHWREQPLNFTLRALATSLAAVTVSATHPKAYSRQLRLFKRELLGTTPLADKCRIVNENHLTFREQDGHLLASADEPLQIENKALGYRIDYELTRFDTYRGATYFAGTSRFTELTPENPQQAERWNWNRQLAYRGSLRHLLACLVAGTYQQEGYQIYQAEFTVPQNPAIPIIQFVNKNPGLVAPDSIIKPGGSSQQRRLISAKPLEIFYTRRRSLRSPYPGIPYAYSLLILPNRSADITAEGWLEKPMGLEIRGDMSSDRLANLLPADWKPTVSETAFESDQLVTRGMILKPDQRLDSLTRRSIERQQRMTSSLFVQVDKPVYLTGDQVWMSGYVLEPATLLPASMRLDGQSETIHLELVSPVGKPLYHQWISSNEGRFSADFRLADSLSTGVYTLRAYPTGERDHRAGFERKLTIIQYASGPLHQPHRQDPLEDIDLQFLPEGGHWVANLAGVLGIKALDRWGRGIALKGQILASDGSDPLDFTTDHRGFGRLGITPRPGVSYQARITTPSQSTLRSLPAVELSGLGLSVDALSDTTQVKLLVRASEDLVEPIIYLTVLSRGQLIRKAKLKLMQGYAEFPLSLDALPAGLAVVTLFDSLCQPRAERVMYVPPRQAAIGMDLTVDQPGKSTHQPVKLLIKLTGGDGEGVAMTGSASVVDADQLPADSAASLPTHVLLSGELSGRVENPNQYVTQQRPGWRLALDNLLLTQGWRRLSWPSSVDSASLENGIRLSGRVLDRRNRPLSMANLLVQFANASGILFARSARSDKQGRFGLEELNVQDTVQVRIRVMDQQFRPQRALIQLEEPGGLFDHLTETVQTDLGWLEGVRQGGQSRQREKPYLYRQPDARLLDEVNVRASRYEEDIARKSSIHGSPDAVIRFDERGATYSNVYEMIGSKVPGVSVHRNSSVEIGSSGYKVTIRGTSSFGSAPPPLYLLDGVYIAENGDGNALMMVNTAEIERIEVIKNAGANLYGAQGGAGVIALYSRKWVPGQSNVQSEETRLLWRGYSTPRQFYLPRYQPKPEGEAKVVDRRDVLYWKPLCLSDSRGESTLLVPVDNKVRRLRLTLQGVSREGQPFCFEKELTVQ